MIALLFAAVPLIHGVTIQCNFLDDYWNSIGDNEYTCIAVTITSDGNLTHVINITGNHESGKTDEDVKAFWIESNHKQFTRLPKGVEKIFLNMIVFAWGYGALETLTADDLEPYPNLQRLDAYDNQLTSLDGDLFKHTPQLKYLHFRGNQLRHVGSGLLDGLHSLKRAYFEKNYCINVGAETPAQIRELKLILWNRCPPLATTTTRSATIEPGQCSIECIEVIETLKEENKRQDNKIAILSDAIQELEKQMRELWARPLKSEIVTDSKV